MIVEYVPQNKPKGRQEVKFYNDKGIFYKHGMGCEYFENCFECPFEDCKFYLRNGKKDWRFLCNRGDGVKGW